MPVQQKVFKMPSSVLQRGSSDWIKSVIKAGRYSFVDCVCYPPLMEAYVKDLIKAGVKPGETIAFAGWPRKQDDENPPDPSQLYILNPSRVVKPRAITHQRDLPFLRASSFQAAVLACKNACLYPVQVSKYALHLYHL